jgi:hypothetical protein
MQLESNFGDDEKCAKRSHGHTGRTSRINRANLAVERGLSGRWGSDGPHEMVKRDAGQYTFLCVQNTLSTISAAVFAKRTQPPSKSTLHKSFGRDFSLELG